MAQDPRVILEITQWLRYDGQVRMRAELLDVLDVLVPLAPVPPLEVRIKDWPQMHRDLLVLVEAQLWAELVKLVSSSSERTLVLGALRVLVQLISWHPQLARDILQLPVPRQTNEIVGSMLNSRLAELVLSSDIDIVSAALELLLNMVRIEALAKALDHERGQIATTSEDSGVQTPVFGMLRAPSQEIVEESAPSMLPSGLVSLVALVLQQWMAAILPQQQQQQRPLYVSINELFSRYTIAKQGQTAPRIGRALTLNEIVRVVAAVFPRTNIQKAASSVIALHLRQKTPHIVPIPELPASTETKATTAAAAGGDSASQCRWTGCQELFTSEEQAIEHLQAHIADADACRWSNCSRVSGTADIVPWLNRHILIHGPFYTQEATSKPPAAAHTTDKDEEDDKSKVLDLILPISSDKQQSVLRLVLQGVGVVEQLQKWADRRSGSQGEYDRARVWRCSDEVIDRIMFIAAQHTTPVAVYAARLLAAISKPSF
ncbi:hypothetical protein LPJ78_002972 [Coemansia sp. RSA 989]|nr:hypothetical protein LPJ78_002972 [Coemansia sp. RSA 989]